MSRGMILALAVIAVAVGLLLADLWWCNQAKVPLALQAQQEYERQVSSSEAIGATSVAAAAVIPSQPAVPAAALEGKIVPREAVPATVPSFKLTNGVVTLTLLAPDAQRGYYRGTRFDWSGLIARAEYAGHTFFGPFRTKFDPTLHDHVVGPANEFDMETAPPGFAEAKAGGTFMKIGIGLLKKGPEDKYDSMRPTVILQAAPWQVIPAEDKASVEFRQQLSLGAYGYAYSKKISLAAGQGAFTIQYTLKNTGSKPLDTMFYCHNFTLIDDQAVGPDYHVTYPFDVRLKDKAVGAVSARGKELVLGDVGEKTPIWTILESGQNNVADDQVTVENVRTKAGVRIVGDQPLAQWRFYAAPTAACPEPFVRIQLQPGGEKTWSFTYTLLVPAAEKKG
jgi:hypothetical protein